MWGYPGLGPTRIGRIGTKITAYIAAARVVTRERLMFLGAGEAFELRHLMHVFDFGDRLTHEYASYIESFIQIRDARIAGQVRQVHLRTELDAYYARLYGLSRDELRYILDPKDVYGPDFPGETFRVLKEKEEKRFGEYRTRRLVLEKWDQLSSTDAAHGR